MPLLGADMEAGTLVEWLKHPGDVVHRGDIIAVVDTQKGAIEIEVFEDGRLERVLVEPGTRVPVGTVLAIISNGQPSPPPGRIRVSPAARALAAAHGIDPATVTGTGPGGAVTREDVARIVAAATAKPGAAAAPGVAPDRAAEMRAAIGAAMARSKREIPHFYLLTTIDMRVSLEWLQRENASRPVAERVLPIALLVRAVALALREHPQVNGFWINGGFRPGTGIHVGSAIALRGGGLIAPAVHDADRKRLSDVMQELRDLVMRARAGGLRSSELSEPTITVTSLGDEGVEVVHGIIYPPQVALVGFGSIVPRPAIVDGQLRNVPIVHATLAADHRAVDGRRGALFLATLGRLLQQPEQL